MMLLSTYLCCKSIMLVPAACYPVLCAFACACAEQPKAMPTKSPTELAGKYEMIKDTNGNEKKGLCLTIYPCGPCLVSAHAFSLSWPTTLCHESRCALR